MLPVNWGKRIFILDRDWAKKIPWEILILFGGGLSLAGAISTSGLTDFIGENLRQFDDSSKHTKFLQNLDDEKRNLFELQMNSTKIRFIEAQGIMQNMLNNGTSYEKARLAYLDYLSMSHEEMNSFIKNIENSENSLKLSTNSTEN